MGGEEFCILLPQTSQAEALCFAERLRQIVAASVLAIGSKRISISVSIGVAEAKIDDSLIEAVVNRADTYLYEAKESGRNCVCAASK